MDEWGRPTTVDGLNELITEVTTAADAYAAASEVWSGAMVVAGASEVAYGLWLLWGGLTDRVEVEPDAESRHTKRCAALPPSGSPSRTTPLLARSTLTTGFTT